MRIATRVLDVTNDAPIASALVMVLRLGIDAGAIDVNRLDDQVLAWGRSNTQGDVQLKQPVPVPGTYTVFVKATGTSRFDRHHDSSASTRTRRLAKTMWA